MSPIRMAQYGTKHGHAAGKLSAMQRHPEVELAGVFEPDIERRRQLQYDERWQGVFWFESEEQLLGDPSIVAVASEGLNAESLPQTQALVAAGKHVWYDKPAGEDWPLWQTVVADARRQGLYIQMGYMFRYHEGFARIANWARSGALGDLFAIRAHMSTHLTPDARRVIAVHRGGIYYDLAGHMLDQIVWILGRPERVTSILRHDDGDVVPGFVDNSLVIHEFATAPNRGAIAVVDIAAMEPRPMARRYEVYGTRGSAILLEPFEPAKQIRLCLEEPIDGYSIGVHQVPVAHQSRQDLYDLELDAFLRVLRGEQAPDRPPEHELLVQETLLRGTGVLS
ncbi:MAG: Gfo/Idh/MocA family oxidoreductase [Chloroflexi bacterium]|nr:Gfo/Idh/MocA family oxidoreductase [Chloroflexota bacterium]